MVKSTESLPSNSTSKIALPKVARPPVTARTKMILDAPIVSTLLRLSLPNVLNLLALTGMITFDGLFLGQLGADALIGVSLVFPFVMFVQHVAAGGVGGAVSSAVARAIGAGDMQRANALAAHAFALSIAMAAVFGLVMQIIGPKIFTAMGGRGAALDTALEYSAVVFGGAVFICMLNLLANVVRGTGDMGYPARVLLGSVLGHIILSPLLIFGWGPLPALGPAGAGWGLVISFAAGTTVLLRYLRSGRALVTLTLVGAKYERKLFMDILRVGVPGMINVAITNLAVVIMTGIVGQLGRDAAIGYAIGARLEYIMIPIGFGFGTSLVAMIGTNWGAKNFARVRRIASSGALTVAVFCGAVGAFFAAFPSLWLGLFTAEGDVAREATLYLRIVAPGFIFYGVGMALFSVMQGIGKLLPVVLANGLRLVISSAGAALAIACFDTGPTGVFIAVTVGFVVHGLANTWIAWHTINSLVRKSQPSH
jgi:putative MATE family efflux protein